MSGADGDMLRRAQEGDMEAFAALFEPLRASVFRTAAGVIGVQDAEDATMETYLRAWQALPRFGGRSSLKTWLHRIAFNCAMDLARERRRRPWTAPGENGEDDALEQMPDTRQDAPDRAAARADDIRAVQSALARLPPEHRHALHLRYAEGFAYGEIATAAGVSVGTVMSRLFYGKLKLKQELSARSPS